MLCFCLFVEVFFISFIILSNIINLNSYIQSNNFEFNCMQLDNSNNANNLYSNVESNNLSNSKTIITNIELNNNNNNNSKKNNNN